MTTKTGSKFALICAELSAPDEWITDDAEVVLR
jgi:hypothetical protein